MPGWVDDDRSGGFWPSNLSESGAQAVRLDLEQADVAAAARVLQHADVVVYAAGAGYGSPLARKVLVDRDAAITVALRSILVPLKATFGFLLTVGVTFGITVAVFHKGWGASLFGVESPEPLVSFLPIIMMGVLFGLAMDYEVSSWLGCGKSSCTASPTDHLGDAAAERFEPRRRFGSPVRVMVRASGW